MRTTSAMPLRKVATRRTSRAAKKLGQRSDFSSRQAMYNQLKRIIPGTTKTTPFNVLDTKLKKARSNPDMVALMSQFKYNEVLEVAKELVAKGLFDLPPSSGSRYVEVSKAVREAAREPSSEENLPDDISRSGFRRLERFQSAVTEVDLPNSPSNTPTPSFDQLLKDHLEISRAASAASAVSHDSKPVEVLESTRSTKPISGSRQATAVSMGVSDRQKRGRITLRDSHGRYLETHVEKIYSLLKPCLKGVHYHHSVSFQKIGYELRVSPGLHELMWEYRPRSLVSIARKLCIRGLFLVDYARFPTYREAAEEARKLVPRYADLPLPTCGIISHDASQLLSPYPWELPKLPYMYGIELVASRDTTPDFQRLRLLPAPEGSDALHNNESSNIMETQIPASDLKQTTEPNAAGSQISYPEIPGTSEQVLVQSEISNPAALVQPEASAHHRPGKPNQTLRVGGLSPPVDAMSLFKKFAEFSPVRLELINSGMAFITFTDIEAATTALKANDGTFFDGRELWCGFTKSRPRRRQVTARVVASRQLVNDHVRDLSSLPGDTWDEHPDYTPVKGEAIIGAPTYKTAGAVSKVPAQSIADKLSLPSRSHLPDLDDATSTEKESSKSNVESLDDRLENKQFHVSVPAPAMSDGLGADEGMMSTKNSASDPPSSNLRWDTLLDARDLKKNSNMDPVDTEISRHATMAVPETMSLFLPHSVQHKILCGLQASLEKVCFEYIMRTTPNVLQESQTSWGIDNPHALELNQYMRLFAKLKAFGSKSIEPDNSGSMSRLHNSLILLRNSAVHRKRSSVLNLRRWTHDAYTLAILAGDSKAAAQFENLGRYLEVEQQRMYADKKEAEERLLATVKKLAAKRAELDRLEQEAMDRFIEEHERIRARDSADLNKAIDATLSLDYGLGSGCEKTSSIEPTSPDEPVPATEPASSTVPTVSPAVPITSPAELTTSTIVPTMSPIVPTSLPIMPTALSVERTIIPAESLSLVFKDLQSTDPVSGIFGRLKLWYGA